MKKMKLMLAAAIAILANTSCLRMENISSDSNTTSIKIDRNFLQDTSPEVLQLLQQELADFPSKNPPIRYNKKTATSTINIKLKRKRVKINYYSSSTENNEQEIMKIYRIKTKIEALKR